MADLLDKGSAWLTKQRRKGLSRTVTYVRGQSTVDVQATLGASEFERDGGGFPVTFHSVDFLIDVADLEIDGLPTEPRRGDLIVDDGGGSYDPPLTYELLDNLGGPPWKYSDGGYRRTYRVHTKLIEQAS